MVGTDLDRSPRKLFIRKTRSSSAFSRSSVARFCRSKRQDAVSPGVFFFRSGDISFKCRVSKCAACLRFKSKKSVWWRLLALRIFSDVSLDKMLPQSRGTPQAFLWVVVVVVAVFSEWRTSRSVFSVASGLIAYPSSGGNSSSPSLMSDHNDLSDEAADPVERNDPIEPCVADTPVVLVLGTSRDPPASRTGRGGLPGTRDAVAVETEGTFCIPTSSLPLCSSRRSRASRRRRFRPPLFFFASSPLRSSRPRSTGTVGPSLGLPPLPAVRHPSEDGDPLFPSLLVCFAFCDKRTLFAFPSPDVFVAPSLPTRVSERPTTFWMISKLNSLGRNSVLPTSHTMLFSPNRLTWFWFSIVRASCLKSLALCSSNVTVPSISGLPHSSSQRKYTSSTALVIFCRR